MELLLRKAENREEWRNGQPDYEIDKNKKPEIKASQTSLPLVLPVDCE